MALSRTFFLVLTISLITSCVSTDRKPAFGGTGRFQVVPDSNQSFLIEVPGQAAFRLNLLTPKSFHLHSIASDAKPDFTEEFVIVKSDDSRPPVKDVSFDVARSRITTPEMSVQLSNPRD